MTETHKQTFFVVEVAPSQFLAMYLPDFRSVKTTNIFPPYERKEIWKTTDGYYLWAKWFQSEEAVWEDVDKWGNKDDFLNWCKDLQKEYGGDGKPRIRKITATLTAEIEEGEELHL